MDDDQDWLSAHEFARLGGLTRQTIWNYSQDLPTRSAVLRPRIIGRRAFFHRVQDLKRLQDYRRLHGKKKPVVS